MKINIADRLPENSPNSFVDLQSKKTVKKTHQKIVFSLKAEMLYVIFWLENLLKYSCLYQLLLNNLHLELHIHLTLSLWIKVNKSQFQSGEVISERGKSRVTKKINHANKKICSTKSEKWRHACVSVEIAWTNEQKVVVTSYGRNRNLVEIKKTKRRPIIAPAIAVRLLKNWQ